MEIILRSASPRRKELLEREGYKFKIVPADIDESINPSLSPLENVKLIGLKKAKFNSEMYTNSIIIGCDTIVTLDGIIYGKPKDENDAYRMLKLFSNKTHEVMSGVGIIYNEKIYNFVVTSKVTFKDLTDKEIYDYIATKECFGKAGAYAIQGIGKSLVLKYEGELENIIGLPIKEVKEILDTLMEA